MKPVAAIALLYLARTAFGQNVSTQVEATTPPATPGNCICEGRGELRSDHVLDWIKEDGDTQKYLFALGDLPPVPTCQDVQNLYADVTECPEALWLDFCCTDVPPQYQCAEQVRSQVLDGYDKLTVPSNSLIHDLVNVSVQMRYLTVTEIKEAQGVMEILIWLTLKWKDPRLAWDYDPSANGTCTALPINMRAEKQQGLKDSEIWVPEFDLYNQVTGVSGLTGVLAVVGRDGSVQWFRQGRVRAICQMEDLGQIPFDNLGCQMLMGSKSLGVRYVLDESGAMIVSNYSGPYDGYRLVGARPGVNDDPPIPVIFFDFLFERGTQFYIQNIVVPVAIFSYCSILTMLVGVGAFQTLALNFTLLLVTVTQKISTSRLLPVTNEALWLLDFVFGSFYFIVFTIAETFFKFIILKMREEREQERQQAEERQQERQQAPTEEDAENAQRSKSDVDAEEDAERTKCDWRLPPWFFTFSMRRVDVTCACISLTIYTIYIIVFFSAKHNWGGGVQFSGLVTNSTDPEL